MLVARKTALVDVAIPAAGEANCKEDRKLVVVGDTHGQLNDVLWIFNRHGPPSATTSYIFNGDIADRGEYAVEIFILVLAFKLRYPNSVHILRGNHEHSAMNERSVQMGGGFAQEVVGKHGTAMYEQFERLFKALPLFALINDEIIVVHAGLPRVPGTSLDQLRTLELMDHYPIPRSRKEISMGVESSWTAAESIVFDAQWADPHEGTGIDASRRGADVVRFGRDVTERFLKENKLQLCVRSHEVPPRPKELGARRPGFSWSHDGNLLTVFSASNYGGVAKNRAAVAIFRDATSEAAAAAEASSKGSSRRFGNMALELVEFDAPDMSRTKAALEKHQSTDGALPMDKVFSAHSAAHGDSVCLGANASLTAADLSASGSSSLPTWLLYHAKAKICWHKEYLWSFCSRRAEDEEWMPMSVLEAELSRLEPADGIPWGMLMRNLGLEIAPCPETHTDEEEYLVKFQPLLSRFQISWFAPGFIAGSRQAGGQLRKMLDRVVFAKLSWQEARDLFDADSDGFINEEEGLHVLRRLLPALSERQSCRIWQALLRNCGGDGGLLGMPLDRFLAGFQLTFAVTEPMEEGPRKDMLTAIVHAVTSASRSVDERVGVKDWVLAGEALMRSFRAWDTDGDGFLSHEELLEQLRRISTYEDVPLDAKGEADLVTYLDMMGTGDVTVFQFIRAFAPVLPGMESRRNETAHFLAKNLFDNFSALLFSYRPQLLRGCRALDAQKRGELSREAFLSVVQALLHALAAQTSGASCGGTAQMLELEESLGAVVRYDELLRGLTIVDTAQSSFK
eukprot:TRINITY_DN17865_c0_g1_i1.p1 TRINITY_DN17865_c0_g1~~TRINITY_DN17865_c0_g1_i1.p1  ORF type:complete len:906 (-),score=202.54 TRINITY_DN17865_c0_g1_i1:7-2391(-)